MPSGGLSPSSGLQLKIYTVTSSDIVGEILSLHIQSPFLYYEFNTDASWNGTVVSETQYDDLSWNLFDTATTANHSIIDFFGTFSKLKPTNIFPPIFRFRVTVPATLGSCKITVYYF